MATSSSIAVHQRYMARAIKLAKKAKERTWPNPMVGAVVVKSSKIVGEGFHKRAGMPHAEVVAIEDAGKAAKGADLYVTLEPCHCVGRTGPCVELIEKAQIRRVFIGAQDPNPTECGESVAVLRRRGIEVVKGVLEDECLKLNEVYNVFMPQQRPFVVVKEAASLDGRIATKTGDSQWISGEEAREFAHRLRARSNAVMIGARTARIDDPRMNVRNSRGRNPAVVVLDSGLSISPKARMFAIKRQAPIWLYCSHQASESRKARLKRAGAEVICVSSRSGKLNLPAVLSDLFKRGVYRLLVEGGSSLIGSLIEKRLVDRVEIVVSPLLLGSHGIPLSSHKGATKVSNAVRIGDLSVKRYGQDVCCSGRLIWP
jgi:diaminohydroxyphosphoribosylaminopyrimidine deaminase/5-amino-6-(5-phosphoribosylamino)uracil reductase